MIAPRTALRRSALQNGFTIVELLIVVVVIAILAAITIVSYNGITLRAENTSRLSTAEQAIKVIKMYKVTGSISDLLAAIPANQGACYGKGLPDVDGDGRGDCTYKDGTSYTSNIPAVDTMLATTGAYNSTINYPALPTSDGGILGGLSISNYSSTIDGRTAHLQLRYYLKGEDMDCGVSNVLTTVDDGSEQGRTYTLSGAKNTGTIDGVTACVIDLSDLEGD